MNSHRLVKLYSRAPTRIDLAGGTVDIWPIYLLLRQPITINLGISLFAESHLAWDSLSTTPGVILESEDQKTELALSWDALRDLSLEVSPKLELHVKLVRHFLEKRLRSGWLDTLKGSLRLSTLAQSPAGAGLGGSSTLSVSMVGALASWANSQAGNSLIDPQTEGERLIEIVRDVETTVIRVPAGLQDYYGAMFGGLQCLKWGVGTHEREPMDLALLSELEDRLLLFYSGQSRNSGINNWALFKGFIDQREEVRGPFASIVKATHELRNALLAQDWTAVGAAIAKEWLTRKDLAPGISTPEIDQAFQEAQRLAPVSGKVCGAGGGGCFFIYLPLNDSSERKVLRQKIEEIFSRVGMRPLPFQAVPHGLQIQVNHREGN